MEGHINYLKFPIMLGESERSKPFFFQLARDGQWKTNIHVTQIASDFGVAKCLHRI